MKAIIIEDEDISGKLLEQFIRKTGFTDLIGSFSNPVEALAFLANNKTDLVFLDMEMPEMSGLEFINTVQNQTFQIIVTTSHRDFAVDAFEHDVTHYLVKPITYPSFFKAVSRAKEIFKKETPAAATDDILFVKKGSSVMRLHTSDILWVEALGDYIVLHNGLNKFIVHSTMKDIETRLSKKDYLRVHRSFIVRIDRIDKIEDGTISFGNKLIPIGKSYKESVAKRLNTL